MPIRRVGHRANLMLGADREMVLMVAMAVAALVFVAQDMVAIAFGSVLWFAGLMVLRRAAKADPHMRQVYLRHIRFRPYYPARSTPFRRNTGREGR